MKRIAALCFAWLAPLALHAQSKQFDSKPLAIEGVTVIDTAGGPIKSGQTITVEGNRISQVGDEKKVHAPKGAQVVSGRGLYAIPGLWDMDIQVSETDRTFSLLIASGVLGIREMGGRLDDLKRWRSAVTNGELLGPRMVIAGSIAGAVDPAHPGDAIVVHNVAEVRSAVDSFKQSGIDFIEVPDNLTADEYDAVADQAKKGGLPFVGQLPKGVWASDASTAGQLSIEHLLGSLAEASKNFDQIVHLGDPPPGAPAGNAAYSLAVMKLEAGSLDAERLKNLASLLAKNGTWQDPALVAAKAMAFLNDDAALNDPRLAYISRKEQKDWSDLRDRLIKTNPPEYWTLSRALYEEKLAITREYHQDGVSILAGTDAGDLPYVIPGFDLHNELAALVSAGFTPLEALQLATLRAADFLGRADDFGSVTHGKYADFILLDANPLDDIHNTQKIRAVVVQGKYLDRAALDALLAKVKSSAQ